LDIPARQSFSSSTFLSASGVLPLGEELTY
jgi:hypothetical protein